MSLEKKYKNFLKFVYQTYIRLHEFFIFLLNPFFITIWNIFHTNFTLMRNIKYVWNEIIKRGIFRTIGTILSTNNFKKNFKLFSTVLSKGRCKNDGKTKSFQSFLYTFFKDFRVKVYTGENWELIEKFLHFTVEFDWIFLV